MLGAEVCVRSYIRPLFVLVSSSVFSAFYFDLFKTNTRLCTKELGKNKTAVREQLGLGSPRISGRFMDATEKPTSS